jgi:hypothetical protein
MEFVKKALNFLGSLYNIILTVFLIVVFIVFTVWIQIDLTASNVTWIYSSSMQTLAALIALLPISYGYYINNLDDEKYEELDGYIVEKLKSDVYHNMMTVIIYSLFVIILNLIGFFIVFNVIFAFIIALLTIEGIGLIAIYIYRLFDPNQVSEVLKEFDSSYNVDPDQKQISLDTFISEYLELETQVKDFVSNENDNELADGLPLYDIVDNLSKDFPEIQENFDIFKEIIFHRNNLIHNYTDTVVDYGKYSKMIELKELFEKLNTMFVQKRIFGNVVKIKNTIEKALKEYRTDYQNISVVQGDVPSDFKEEIVSLLHSYFVSDYYFSKSLDNARDTDFEVIQNNFSERKLLGIDIKSIHKKSVTQISTSFFKRMNSRFLYVFLINFEPTTRIFTVYYKTKDNELRTYTVKQV